MAIRIVREKGDSVLNQPAMPVRRFNATTSRLVDDMFETMAHYNGIGLAAPQVGIPKQIIVIDTGVEGERLAMINPSLLDPAGREIDVEGCLSIPGVYGEVERDTTIRVRYLDVQGEVQELWATGLLARVIQHEFDHLCGRLFDERVIRFIDPDEDEDPNEGEDVG